jgi:hypothetical protein
VGRDLPARDAAAPHTFFLKSLVSHRSRSVPVGVGLNVTLLQTHRDTHAPLLKGTGRKILGMHLRRKKDDHCTRPKKSFHDISLA